MSTKTYSISVEALAPYLWYVHAHTRLPPFYDGDGFGYVLKDEAGLSEAQKQASIQLSTAQKELPDEFWTICRDSRWEALPDVADSSDQVDKRFFRNLAAYILSEGAREKTPNQTPEPTPPSVTPRAAARVAPAGDMAHP